MKKNGEKKGSRAFRTVKLITGHFEFNDIKKEFIKLNKETAALLKRQEEFILAYLGDDQDAVLDYLSNGGYNVTLTDEELVKPIDNETL